MLGMRDDTRWRLPQCLIILLWPLFVRDLPTSKIRFGKKQRLNQTFPHYFSIYLQFANTFHCRLCIWAYRHAPSKISKLVLPLQMVGLHMVGYRFWFNFHGIEKSYLVC